MKDMFLRSTKLGSSCLPEPASTRHSANGLSSIAWLCHQEPLRPFLRAASSTSRKAVCASTSSVSCTPRALASWTSPDSTVMCSLRCWFRKTLGHSRTSRIQVYERSWSCRVTEYRQRASITWCVKYNKINTKTDVEDWIPSDQTVLNRNQADFQKEKICGVLLVAAEYKVIDD